MTTIEQKRKDSLNPSAGWKTAKTPFFEYVTAQLSFCQMNGVSRLLCDVSDIGKSHTALHYYASNSNVVYVDCSQHKTRQQMVRFIAGSFGVRFTGNYQEVYKDLIAHLCSLPNPLVILDEAGDLDYEAFLELKALWNATEGICGWYMMGADGLRQKIDTRIAHRKVGYTEIFSRYGNRYQKASPDAQQELKEFKMVHAAMIIKQNFPQGTDIPRTIAAADFTLRNLKDELKKRIA